MNAAGYRSVKKKAKARPTRPLAPLDTPSKPINNHRILSPPEGGWDDETLEQASTSGSVQNPSSHRQSNPNLDVSLTSSTTTNSRAPSKPVKRATKLKKNSRKPDPLNPEIERLCQQLSTAKNPRTCLTTAITLSQLFDQASPSQYPAFIATGILSNFHRLLSINVHNEIGLPISIIITRILHCNPQYISTILDSRLSLDMVDRCTVAATELDLSAITALVGLTFGTLTETHRLVDDYCIPVFVRALESPSEEIRVRGSGALLRVLSTIAQNLRVDEPHPFYVAMNQSGSLGKMIASAEGELGKRKSRIFANVAEAVCVVGKANDSVGLHVLCWMLEQFEAEGARRRWAYTQKAQEDKEQGEQNEQEQEEQNEEEKEEPSQTPEIESKKEEEGGTGEVGEVGEEGQEQEKEKDTQQSEEDKEPQIIADGTPTDQTTADHPERTDSSSLSAPFSAPQSPQPISTTFSLPNNIKNDSELNPTEITPLITPQRSTRSPSLNLVLSPLSPLSPSILGRARWVPGLEHFVCCDSLTELLMETALPAARTILSYPSSAHHPSASRFVKNWMDRFGTEVEQEEEVKEKEEGQDEEDQADV
ncbi:hypothetical protein BLNAU_21889 [Blattamonas nauphoetae]|uniref:Uncharacterized protein n=1 Tax=Blattamonas nauphoetae TaxID=2049346 RepID=A0ABQ9WVQ6_9EUKA|nr:hypothetical protein BLNAU_21889 [Blattamonas nauphoetae]